jgi:hypothetical protein
LRAGIARGRSCAPVLVIPSKKNELVCHGQSWSSVAGRGSSPERVKRRTEEGRGGAARGRHGELLGAPWEGLLGAAPFWWLLCVCSASYVRRKKQQEGEEKKEEKREKRKKKKGKKRKTWKNL